MTSSDLKARREAAGLSIQQLAKEAGVAWRSIYRWEDGYRISSLAQRALDEALSKHPSATPQDHVSRIAVPSRKSKRTRK